MKSIYQIIKAPRLTEKANLLQETENKVVFRVDINSNKIEIKQAVEQLFHVKVKKVAILHIYGKDKRVGVRSGKTSNWKKAYVTLSEGKINFLDQL